MRQALAAGELDDRDAIEAAAQLLDALAHAHAKGIVHRDVKPSNVLLGESDDVDVRLLDFGLAQMDEFDTLTAVGDVPGTLTYVPPERLKGETATAAADIWAVGVMLWEALAGRHPVPQQRRRGDPAPDPSPAHRRSSRSAPTSPEPSWPRSRRRSSSTRRSARPRRSLRPSCAASRGSAGAGPGEVDAPRAAARRRACALRRLAKERVAPVAAAGIWTGWVTSALPFYPAGLAARPDRRRGARPGFAFPRAALAVSFADHVLPAREHLARARAPLRRVRRGLDRGDLA